MTQMRRAKLFDGTSQDGPFFLPDHPRLDESRRDAVVSFLEAGSVVQRAAGLSQDVVDGTKGKAVPIATLTDGEWIWSAGHAYYLKVHGLAPEPDFLAYIEGRNFEPRRPSEDEVLAALELIRPSRAAQS